LSSSPALPSTSTVAFPFPVLATTAGLLTDDGDEDDDVVDGGGE
jgi:hypothetical protein